MVMMVVPSAAKLIEPLVHGLQRNRLGEIVVLVAIGASQVAAAHGNDVRQNRMIGGGQAFIDHPQLARTAMDPFPGASDLSGYIRHQEIS